MVAASLHSGEKLKEKNMSMAQDVVKRPDRILLACSLLNNDDQPSNSKKVCVEDDNIVKKSATAVIIKDINEASMFTNSSSSSSSSSDSDVSRRGPKTSKSQHTRFCIKGISAAATGNCQDFHMDGPVGDTVPQKLKKINKKVERKQLKRSGHGLPLKRVLGARHSDAEFRCCKQHGKCCDKFDEHQRFQILNSFWDLADLQLQCEYIVRFVQATSTSRKTVEGKSRREMSRKYTLPLKAEEKLDVCKSMFLKTLNVSDKFVRCALGKVLHTGVIDKDKRGGRYNALKVNDEELRNSVRNHIAQFPRVESHYCRQSTSRQYLNANLSVKIMHDM